MGDDMEIIDDWQSTTGWDHFDSERRPSDDETNEILVKTDNWLSMQRGAA